MMNRPAAEEIFHKGLAKTKVVPPVEAEMETDPSKCIWHIKSICYRPDVYGERCDGICGDAVTHGL